MTELRKNSYEDSDFRDVIAEIEGMDDDIKSIMATAMGKAAGIRKKIKATKKRAKDDLAIPTAILNASLKTRALERKIQDIANDVPDELTEMWVDAAGQFSWLAPIEDEPAEEPAPTRAAKRRKKAAEANEAAEQATGAEVLKELATVN